jgi:hypothetical protein
MLFHWVGYRTARRLLPVITAGSWRAADASESGQRYDWKGARRDADGTLAFSPAMSGWIGVLVWIALFATLMAIRDGAD